MNKCPVEVSFPKCIGCLQCVKECPTGVLTSNYMKSTVTSPERCIACGHCASVCPAGAISFYGKIPNKVDTQTFESAQPKLVDFTVNESIPFDSIKFTAEPNKTKDKPILSLIENAKYSYRRNHFKTFEIEVKRNVENGCIVSVVNDTNNDDVTRFLSTLSVLCNYDGYQCKWINEHNNSLLILY